MNKPPLTPDNKPAVDCQDWTFNPTHEEPSVWITLGNRSIHLIATFHHDGDHELKVAVYPLGKEAGDPVDTITTTFRDLPNRALHST